MPLTTDLMHLLSHGNSQLCASRMGNTRSKTLKTCISQPSIEDSEHQSTHPEALVGSNDDLLTEILLRLPVTSILRFKSVCKHWRWLLSHRHLTHRYDKLSKTPGLFGQHTYIPFVVQKHIYVPFDVQSQSPNPNFNPDVTISQSCNGLLLCYEDISLDRKYHVFNPTTNQLATIPSVLGGHHFLSMSLAYHQTECGHFKIVCVCEEKNSLYSQIQVYSSDTGKWKISVESFQTNGYKFGNGVYYNGAIYWPPSRGNLLCFDIDVTQMQTLPSPTPVEVKNSSFEAYVGESRGHLHLIQGERLGDNNLNLHLKVYEMLRDRSGWFVKYQVELDDLCHTYPHMILSNIYYDFSVIDMVRGEQEEEEDTFIVLKIRKKNLITYNVLDKSFKHLYDITEYGLGHFTRFYRYTEALTYF